MSVDTTVANTEFNAAGPCLWSKRLVTLERRVKKSFGLVFAPARYLKEFSTVQATGKNQISPIIHAATPSPRLPPRHHRR